MQTMLSVVIPAYNEEAMILKCSLAVSKALEAAGIDYELIFVDDGSKDCTWKNIMHEADRSGKIRGISFSRNFGKEAAIYAGLKESLGGCVAVMDADLQHPPAKLEEMYRLWQDGYEIIEGVKASRGEETGLHRAAAGMFYSVIGKAAGRDMSGASDFKLLDRKVVDVLLSIPEKNMFFRAMSSWVGFKTATVTYDVEERAGGESKWSTRALISYAFTNIASFTTLPMQLVLWCGVITFLVGFIFSFIAICQKAAGVAVEGFTTVIILLCFIGSIIMMALGIIGFYIAKIYDEVKGRPRYIIRERS